MTATDSAEQVTGSPVPLRLDDEISVFVKFNMASLSAINARYKVASPLAVLINDSTVDTLAFLVGAGLLHNGSGMPDDAKAKILAIQLDTLTPEAEAQRLSREVMVRLDDPDFEAIRDAIAHASGRFLGVEKCVGCDHAFAGHHWLGACTVEGCACVVHHAALMPCADCSHDLTPHTFGACGTKGCACQQFKAKTEGKEDAEPAETTASTGDGSTTSPPAATDEAGPSSG